MTGIHYGIDPGKGGAIAAVCGEELLWIHDLPYLDKELSVPLLLDIIGEDVHPDLVSLEKVGMIPGKSGSGSGAFNFGQSTGVIKGVFGALRIPIRLVLPSEWKKEYGIRSTKKGAQGKREMKEKARNEAVRLWPEHSELFGRVMDADRAEAGLIALQASRTVRGYAHNGAA